MTEATITGYVGYGEELDASHGYLLPTVTSALGPARNRTLFDLGCGNGSVAERMQALGFRVVGVDPSEAGVRFAHERRPSLRIEQASAYDDLAARYGTFDCLISLEVIEHVYAPRRVVQTALDLLVPGGTAIFSTPYHGYAKNLAIALAGEFDRHFTALWDHGHIKFWSIATLGTLLAEGGFVDPVWNRVGRIPMLAKSMIVVVRKPAAALK